MAGQESGPKNLAAPGVYGVPPQHMGYHTDTSAYTESMLHSAGGGVNGKPPRSAPTTPRYSLI